MSKRSATTLTFGPNAIAHQLLDGPIVIADPDAPIEHGCRVLLVFKSPDPTVPGVGIECRCLTKHPSKAKTGIGISFKNIDGSANQIWGCWISGPKRCVYRIVAEFPPAIPVPRHHARVVKDVYQPMMAKGGAHV